MKKLNDWDLSVLQLCCRDWFEPCGRGWRTCDKLVKAGLLEHNGAERGKGERYRATEAGEAAYEAARPLVCSKCGRSVTRRQALQNSRVGLICPDCGGEVVRATQASHVA